VAQGGWVARRGLRHGAAARSPSDGLAPRAQTITLTFDIDSDPGEIANTTKILNAYMKLHPNIVIKLQPIVGDLVQKEFIKASAGTLPDVMYSADVFTLPFGYRHIIQNMQPYIDADPSFNVKDIFPVMLNLGRFAGDPQHGLYLMPQESDALTIFVNTDLFKAAGVPVPTKGWTYAQFLDAAQKLTKMDASGKVTQYALSLAYNWWANYVPFMVGMGGGPLTADGRHSNFADPKSILGLQMMVDLYTKYKVAVPPTAGQGFDFTLGTVAMCMTCQRPSVPSMRTAIGKKFHWDVVNWPQWPTGKWVNGMGTQGFAVSAGSRNKQAAWSVVKYIASAEGQRVFAETYASVPIRQSLANASFWRNLPGPPYNNEAFITAIKHGITPPTYPPDVSLNCGTVYNGQVNTILNTALDKIVRGLAPVAMTAKSIDQQINSCINSVNQ